MYHEDDWIQLSAIQHYIFCPRQCALIHVDGLWQENIFTAKGRILHEKVDSGEDETRHGVRTVRSLNIYSKRLGLSGRADVVEFEESGGKLRIFPVEYKSGKPKKDISDMAQLTAQALCLEEMFQQPVTEGAIFYGRPRRRLAVELDSELRGETEKIIFFIHELIRDKIFPEAKYGRKCDSCSLYDLCLPRLSDRKLGNYLRGLFKTNEEAS
jgi:CRISPR-associated exonuclease Cas4